MALAVGGFLVTQLLQTYVELQNAYLERDQKENLIIINDLKNTVEDVLVEVRERSDAIEDSVEQKIAELDAKMSGVDTAESRLLAIASTEADRARDALTDELGQLSRQVVRLTAESDEIAKRNSIKLRELHVQKLRNRIVLTAQQNREALLRSFLESLFAQDEAQARISVLRLRRGLERIDAQRDSALSEIEMIADTRVVIYRHGAQNDAAARLQDEMAIELTRLGFDATKWVTSADPAAPTGANDAVKEINAEFSGAGAVLGQREALDAGFVVIGPRDPRYAPILSRVVGVVSSTTGFDATLFTRELDVDRRHLTNLLSERIYGSDDVVLVTRIERWE